MNFLLINYEYPPIGGGGGNATREIARALVRRGHAATVLTTRWADQPAEAFEDSIRLIRLNSPRRHADRSNIYEMGCFMSAALARGLKRLGAFRPDAVIGFFALPGGPPTIQIAHHFRVPSIVCLRGGDVPGSSPDLAWMHRMFAPMLRRVWKGADHLVANSEGLAELARKFEPGVRVDVIPNGVDIERFFPRTQEEPQADRPLRILTIGRLSTDNKALPEGLMMAMRALHGLPDELRSMWRLSIAGDGPAAPALMREVERMDAARQVDFLGWKDNGEVPALMKQSDILLHPTRSEGCPNVVLEAMASGLAVVATQATGTADLLIHGQTGMLSPWGDEADLRKSLEAVLSQPRLRKQLGLQARKFAEQQSWDRVAGQFEDLIARK